MFVAFFIAKSSLMCQNHQKETLSFVSKRDTPFPWWKGMIHVVSMQKRREGCCSAQQSSAPCHPKTKDDTATNTHTNTQKYGATNTQNSNFRFKSREKRTRGSERCYAPRLWYRMVSSSHLWGLIPWWAEQEPTIAALQVWVYVDSDAVRLYLAGKASGWHAGVF